MTENEKRGKGLLYDVGGDSVMLAELTACKDLCYEYNQIKPSLTDEKMAVLNKLLGSIKSIVGIQSPFWCDYGYNIEVGENFYANHGLVILDGAKVVFGDNVFIGPNCGFYTAGHPIDSARRRQWLEFAHPITVGNDVWFGGGVHVMPGVTIGNNVVVAGGSIVTKNVPDNVIVAGNPAKIVRKITEEDAKKEYCYNE